MIRAPCALTEKAELLVNVGKMFATYIVHLFQRFMVKSRN